ncbi:MAG: GNAT family N-acetyltransferase [Candidatus Anammoximicrobium sp.]|nr:GNAT family N-acetyltransferase [Candidatus Anammoximicrobium sp.]
MTDLSAANQPSPAPVTFRCDTLPEDRQRVREIVESTGFFSAAEVDVAVELVDERLTKGDASGYYFVFAELDGRTVGYSCYGPIPATAASYDLYWIAVDRDCQGRKVGRILLEESERLIRAAGGRRLYLDTSSRTQYQPTRDFYEHFRFRCEAVLEDFYAPGDGKVIYVKVL